MKNLKAISIIIPFILSACVSNPPQHPTLVSIIWHKSQSQVIRLHDGKTILLNGRYQMINGVCHVWAPDPPISIINGKRTYELNQWGTLGHEVKHCFDGRFHD